MLVFKVIARAEWRAGETAGIFTGSASNYRAGFLQLSFEAQLREMAAKYFAGDADLVLIELEDTSLGPEPL